MVDESMVDEPAAELLYTVADGIARVTLNRPERRNALSLALMGELLDTVGRAGADEAVRVVVLTGAGDRAFCAGADLGGVGGDDRVGAHDQRGAIADVFRSLWSLGKPTIARVRGYALAGGFGLALACDFVIASDDSQFGTPEIDVGLWPYMITVPMLRSMPPKVALELMTTGRRVAADEAQRIGFVNRVVAAADLDAAVDELAAGLATKPPLVMRLGRDAFYRVLDMRADDALDYLQAMLTVTTLSEDFAEGVTAFSEKRPPEWTGR